MRVYAALLGVLLTAGSGYVAQLAVGSAGFERVPGSSSPPGVPGARSEVWYGGVLTPVTVEAAPARGPETLPRRDWTVLSRLAMSQKTSECARRARPKRHAITSTGVPSSTVGSMM